MFAVAYYTDKITGRASAVGTNSNCAINDLTTIKGVIRRAWRYANSPRFGRLVAVEFKRTAFETPFAVYGSLTIIDELKSLAAKPTDDTLPNFIKRFNEGI